MLQLQHVGEDASCFCWEVTRVVIQKSFRHSLQDIFGSGFKTWRVPAGWGLLFQNRARHLCRSQENMCKQTESFSCVFYPSWLIWPFQVQSLATSTGPNWWDTSKTTLLSLGSEKCLLLLTSCLISKCYCKWCCDISNTYLLRSKTGINRTIRHLILSIMHLSHLGTH